MKKIDCFDREYAFLSNFYEAPVEKDGIVYPTNEHFFQAMKTLDIEKRKEIAAADTPGQAKRMGRKLQLRPDWEQSKYKVMKEGLLLKFLTHKDLAKKLIETEDAWLIEGNYWHDNTWGDCKCPQCLFIDGKNWLGTLLMDIRTRLKINEENE